MEASSHPKAIMLAAVITAIGVLGAAYISLGKPSEHQIATSEQYKTLVDENSRYKVRLKQLETQIKSLEANTLPKSVNKQGIVGIDKFEQCKEELEKKNSEIQTLQVKRDSLNRANERIIALEQEGTALQAAIRLLKTENAELEKMSEQQIFTEPNKTITSNGISFRIESAEVSDYGQKVFIRLLVSNSGAQPIHLMYDGAEGFTITDILGNEIELTRASGIYRCTYGLRGQQYCENYLSKAPIIAPGITHSVSFQGEADDKKESPITGSHFDLNGMFLTLDPTKRLSAVTANFPGIPTTR